MHLMHLINAQMFVMYKTDECVFHHELPKWLSFSSLESLAWSMHV